MEAIKPILAITMGDPAGIGPEIIIKSLSQEDTYAKCRPIVCGDASVMRWTAQALNPEIKINAVKDVSEALFQYGTIDSVYA